MLTGSLVAIVTPMLEDGSLDLVRFKSLIDWHIVEGTQGIVVVGTTGESPTVDFDEHKELIRIAVAHAAGRVPIIAGTGANSTAEAIELSESAKHSGAQLSLSVVPYYNKPTQEGMYRHFRAIAEAVDLPMILYNVPGRTVADLQNDERFLPISRLELATEHPRIRGERPNSDGIVQVQNIEATIVCSSFFRPGDRAPEMRIRQKDEIPPGA